MSSLLKEILERVEYERLIEEGKDPVEVLITRNFKNYVKRINEAMKYIYNGLID